MLLNAPPDTPAVVIRLSPDGKVEERFQFPGITDVWRMTVRLNGNELLFTSAETATLFRARLSPEAWSKSATQK